mmetsp:Transcript_7930/g.10059  ORF Transcript_7930/g.10059 Transcript_7930/m.10059 type:complete len:217 (-) Transcript_7930:625-1275(-)
MNLPTYFFIRYCQCKRETKTLPPNAFPRPTGSKFPTRNSFTDISAPQNIPRGIRNMFATECSRPNATKVVIGSHKAAIFPGEVVAVAAWKMARQTSQFAPTAFPNAVIVVPVARYDVFFMAIAWAKEENGSFMNRVEAKQANPRHPIKLPTKFVPHSFAKFSAFSVVLFRLSPDVNGRVAYIILDVNMSVCVNTIEDSPIGKIKALATACSPGRDS